MKQRSEAYKNYVSDSLFFLQHLYTDPEKDEEHGNMFSMKLRDILKLYDEGESESEPTESAEDIKNRMIEKSLKLSGNKI